MTQDSNYSLPAPLLEALLRYLQNRPWIEVHQAMAALSSLKPIEEETRDQAEHGGLERAQ